MKRVPKNWLILLIFTNCILIVGLSVFLIVRSINTIPVHNESTSTPVPTPTSSVQTEEPTPTPTTVPTQEPTQIPTPTSTPTKTPVPNQTPTPTSTPEPAPEVQQPEQEEEGIDLSEVDPDKVPTYTGDNIFPETLMEKVFKTGQKIKYWIFSGGKPVTDYAPSDIIIMGEPDEYTDLEGVTTFRGNNYRDAGAFGSRNIEEKKLEIVWTKDIGVIDTWPGVGWTGQPMLIHWPEETKNIMNINPEMKSKDLVEVIYPTLDGNIYFLDLESGKQTREPINIGFPTKGTAMIDPRGYPLLYTGQGINRNGDKYSELKYRIFNLIDQSELYSIPGTEPDAFRIWGAFDSSALLDRKTDTLIECGENGLIYKIKLNTDYKPEEKSISISPEITKYRYQGVFDPNIGIENSPVLYKSFLYFADNGGLLQCLDINTMQPVWIANMEDDTDSSMVFEETDDGLFLYTGNEADLRCINSGIDYAQCIVKKINALTGEVVWQRDYKSIYQYGVNGGLLSTPIVGKDDISDLVIFNIAKTDNYETGKMVALNKETGEEVWVKDLQYYSWSSPLDVKSDDGKTYMIFCDYGGHMYLMDPQNGDVIDSISVGDNVEGTPAVYNDMVVVGSYAKKIFGIKIK